MLIVALKVTIAALIVLGVAIFFAKEDDTLNS